MERPSKRHEDRIKAIAMWAMEKTRWDAILARQEAWEYMNKNTLLAYWPQVAERISFINEWR